MGHKAYLDGKNRAHAQNATETRQCVTQLGNWAYNVSLKDLDRQVMADDFFA